MSKIDIEQACKFFNEATGRKPKLAEANAVIIGYQKATEAQKQPAMSLEEVKKRLENIECKIIVDSTWFRKILKDLSPSTDHYIFAFKDKSMEVDGKIFGVEHNHDFSQDIERSSVLSMIKILKIIKHQPIVVGFNRSSLEIKSATIY